MAYVIAGLGNPGGEYAQSRHNAGRLALASFQHAQKFPDFAPNKAKKALVSSGKVGKENVQLVLPETFMNKSGSSIALFVKSVKAANKLVVVYDDLDLPLGKIKISFSRGSGGHKGLESVARAIKTKDFIRIRIGVSKATKKGVAKKVHGEDEVVGFVLGTFSKGEMEELQPVFKKINEALETIVNEGLDAGMNRFN